MRGWSEKLSRNNSTKNGVRHGKRLISRCGIYGTRTTGDLGPGIDRRRGNGTRIDSRQRPFSRGCPGLMRPSLVELIAQNRPSSLLFLKRPNGGIYFLSWLSLTKSVVKCLLSGLVLFKSLIDSGHVFGGHNRAGHNESILDC